MKDWRNAFLITLTHCIIGLVEKHEFWDGPNISTLHVWPVMSWRTYIWCPISAKNTTFCIMHNFSFATQLLVCNTTLFATQLVTFATHLFFCNTTFFFATQLFFATAIHSCVVIVGSYRLRSILFCCFHVLISRFVTVLTQYG